MQQKNLAPEQLEQRIITLIDSCRGRILDIVEAQLGSSPNWRIVRGQILNLLGEKGLSRDVEQVIVSAFLGREQK